MFEFLGIGTIDWNYLVQISTIVVAIVNIILVLFVFLQIRDSRKPIVTTGLVSTEKITRLFGSDNAAKKFWDDANVLEAGYLAFFIRNDSTNRVNKLDVLFNFQFGKEKFEYHEPRLSHLNPQEATYISLKRELLVKKFPDLFDKFAPFDNIEGNDPNRENRYIIDYPKENLAINMTVIISFNPMLWNFFPSQIEDNYRIQWGSFDPEELSPENSSKIIDAKPRMMSLNIRSEVYSIHKMQK